jgi:hypothetical protein
MIPSTRSPNNLVVPLASDLDFTTPGTDPHCYYYSNGVDSLVVSWIDVSEWVYPSNPYTSSHTFQLILCKTDSSITFQYGYQQGDFQNPDGASQIGIEDLVGRTGLRYMYNMAPPDRVPHEDLVIRIHADPDPSFVFDDIGVDGSQNESSGAIFNRVNVPLNLKAYVKNYGTTTANDFTVNAKVKKGYFQVYNENVTVESLEPGEITLVEFPVSYTPDEVDVYSLIYKTTLSGDDFFYNNTDTCEMRAYSLPQILGYADTVYQYTSWEGGGGGFGNEFVAPEDIVVNGIRAELMSNGMSSYFYLLGADLNGNPNENLVLFADTANFVDTGWVQVDIPDGVVIYGGQKFFATILSGGEGISFGVDTSWPLCNRGWEHTGSYAPSRDRSEQDIGITLICDGYVGIEDEDNLPSYFSLQQNYPNPFNANTEINFSLSENSDITLEVYNIAGQKIKTLAEGSFEAGPHMVVWNGQNDRNESISSGIYFYNLKVNDRSETRKMVLIK